MEGEKQCRLSLSEEIYSTLDSVLGGIRTGPGSPVTGARPVNAGASPAHQYGHLCQFHRLQAFQEETGMFQQVADDSPSAEESEHDTLGRAGERCSSKEHGPARASTPAVQSLLACACVWQPPPHSWGDSTEAAPPAQPRSHLSRESSPRAGQPCGQSNSAPCHLHAATVDTEQPTEAPLSPSPRQEGWPGALDTSRGLQLAAKIHSVLGLMVNFLSRKGSSALDADGAGQRQDSGEREAESMARKLKHLQQTKKHLEQEATGFDSSDARSIGEVPVLLEAKLDQYHVLNQELDFLTAKLGSLLESKENPCGRLMEEKCKYQRQLGILMDKVTSYEEIIECADHRLAVSCSHITHLEERNRRLEDLLRRPRERAWRRRLRRLEVQSRSTDRVGSEDGHCPEGHIPV